MSNGSGLSRGDRNRNARLARLRELVPLSNAIVGIDLADGTQAAVVTDHDSRVIARRRVSARAWELGDLLDWAVTQAAGAGFASVTVACEPTGHRWRVLDQLAAGRGLALVCVQPLLVYRAREGEDLTRDKSDPKDAVLIARLASELRCYEPERADEVWARLRHLGARRSQLTTAATAAVNQIRDLLECAWPAVLAAAGSPFRSVTWCASLAVVLDRCAGDLSRVRRLGLDRFTAAVRRELPRWGGIRPRLRIIPGRVRRAGRSRRGRRAPPRRPGTRAPDAGRLAGYSRPARRYRDPDVRGPGGPRADRARHHDRRADRHRGRGDPGRDGRPGPVRHPQGAGQARRAVPARQLLRSRPGQDLDLRPRPARPARGRLAGRLGRDAEQPGHGRPVRSPDHPPGQPAGPPAGQHGLRGRPAALDPCRRHPAGDLGSRHRGRGHTAAAGRMNHPS